MFLYIFTLSHSEEQENLLVLINQKLLNFLAYIQVKTKPYLLCYTLMSYVIPDFDLWLIFTALNYSENHSQSLHDLYQGHISFSKGK